MKKTINKVAPLYQNGELYDAPDMQLALLSLKQQGYDVHVSSTDARRLQVTCNKTKNRFLVECIGHNDWPSEIL
ncbi:MAG: hypothetical protein M3Y50_15635 [Acidobacteriota bacterium]|nr:hypothetical protein [Acidobacteriota bacterium]